MTRVLGPLLLLLTLAGCLRPIQTDSRIHIDGPVGADLPSTSNAQPVVAMDVEPGAHHPGEVHVAIVDVDGILLNTNLAGPYSSGDNPIDLFREKLDTAAADPCALAVVLRINSPGGSVAATDLLWQELQTFREKTHRPVVACIMDLGCGGGYYLATASDQIVAQPTSLVGGIGVLLNLYSLQDVFQTMAITNRSIKAGNNIDLGTSVSPLTPQGRSLLQSIADEFHVRFKTVVCQQRRQLAADKDVDLFDGRVFTGTQAQRFGLVDKVGYLPDALALARQLCNQPHARAVLLHRCRDQGRTPYASTPNVPLQATLLPVTLPSLERSKLPAFLYLWEPEPTMERLGGK